MVNVIPNSKNFSSNINEVIREVSNLLQKENPLQKDFAHIKSTQSTKITKSKKNTKTQPSKSIKRYKWTKIKNALKKNLRGKSNLFAYLRFCVFCAREEKKIENKIMKSPAMEMY